VSDQVLPSTIYAHFRPEPVFLRRPACLAPELFSTPTRRFDCCGWMGSAGLIHVASLCVLADIHAVPMGVASTYLHARFPRTGRFRVSQCQRSGAALLFQAYGSIPVFLPCRHGTPTANQPSRRAVNRHGKTRISDPWDGTHPKGQRSLLVTERALMVPVCSRGSPGKRKLFLSGRGRGGVQRHAFPRARSVKNPTLRRYPLE